jgi:cytosine deaminase
LPDDAFAAISNTAKSVMGLPETQLKIGDLANLMLISAGSIREAIANRTSRQMVMSLGRLTHFSN